MKCEKCFRVIEKGDSYFSGHWVPEESEGYRKFGCAPLSNYCKRCMGNMRAFLNQPERLNPEDHVRDVTKMICDSLNSTVT